MLPPEPLLAPRLVLADPDPAFRQALADGLAFTFGHVVAAQAADARELREAALAAKPDAIVAGLPLEDLLDALGQCPAAVVVLVPHTARATFAPWLVAPVHAGVPRDAGVPAVGLAVEFALCRFQEERRLAGEVEKLQAGIAARKLIERAKGLLMKRHRWSEPEAFRRLQRGAMNRRVSMADLARQILEGADIPL